MSHRGALVCSSTCTAAPSSPAPAPRAATGAALPLAACPRDDHEARGALGVRARAGAPEAVEVGPGGGRLHGDEAGSIDGSTVLVEQGDTEFADATTEMRDFFAATARLLPEKREK